MLGPVAVRHLAAPTLSPGSPDPQRTIAVHRGRKRPRAIDRIVSAVSIVFGRKEPNRTCRPYEINVLSSLVGAGASGSGSSKHSSRARRT
jgi:hypothetical protein